MRQTRGRGRSGFVGLVGLAVGATLAGGAWAQGSAPGASSSRSTAAPSGLALDAPQLVATLHQVNQMEITAGQMAQQNGAMPAVRDFGQMLVRDHQAADDQVTSYARSKGISLADVPTSFRVQQQALQAKLDKLQKMSGAAFDQQFALDMAKAHSKVIAMLDASRPGAKDEGLVVLLDNLEPTLRKHRQMADNILNGYADAASNTAARSSTLQGHDPGR